MNDWGELKLEQIDDCSFWYLIDELVDDESGFLYNRDIILKAYKDGNLYGLTVEESDEMFKRGARLDDIFCDKSYYLLPCFCVKEEDEAIIIWTHSRARNMGFAKKLIELLDIKRALSPLPESIEFWKKCNIKF